MPHSRPAIPRITVEPLPAIEDLTLQILGFLASDQQRLERFFDLTGLVPQTLRRAAEAADFPAHLFEYLCGDERLLCAFAERFGHDPAQIERVRQHLEARGRNAC